MTKDMPEKDGFTLVGYARVSTADQSVIMQVEALLKYGVKEEDIYSESMSGVKKNRPELAKAMRALAPGDTLVVWKLDRIARSINNLLEVMNELEAKGIKFRSITEGIETETPAGKMIMFVMGALAQFERDLIVERTRAGVKAAKERGVRFGAAHKLMPDEMPKVWKMINEKGVSQKKVAEKYGVSVQTIARRLKEYEQSKL
jgi:DNA invertase Pin-like site-specific DNA recombinase